jgi:hypothetical protein
MDTNLHLLPHPLYNKSSHTVQNRKEVETNPDNKPQQQNAHSSQPKTTQRNVMLSHQPDTINNPWVYWCQKMHKAVATIHK